MCSRSATFDPFYMLLFSAATTEREISSNFFFSTRARSDILQQCGRVQQWLKGLLPHHISACMSPMMWLKWEPVCLFFFIMYVCMCMRGFLEEAIIFIRMADSFWSPNTSLCQSRLFTTREKREKRWCNIHSACTNMAHSRIEKYCPSG